MTSGSDFRGLPPLPDESVLGHCGRIGRVNAYAGCLPRLLHTLKAQQYRICPEQSSDVHGLAVICGMNALDYARKHSLLGFSAFALGISKNTVPPWSAKIMQSHGSRSLTRHCKWCADCAAEDQRRYGFSYWHREHQLPGIRLCVTHQKSLLAVGGFDTYLKFPHELVKESQPLCLGDAGSLSPKERRYQAIAHQMIAGPSGPVQALWEELGTDKRLTRGACRFDTDRRRLSMSRSYAQAQFSRHWELDIRGRWNTPEEGNPDLTLALATALAVMLTLAHDSIDDALARLSGIGSVQAESERRTRPRMLEHCE